MNISRGRIPCGQKIVIYGPEGIGKTTLAAQMPGTVFIDTEGSTRNFDVARFDAPSSWEMLKQEAEYALSNPGQVGTLVIDTADWAEKLCNKAVCARANKNGIEEFGYGKGYVYAAEEFGRLLDILDRLSAAGINVVFTAHAQLRKVELPDEMGSYDKWELKCSKQLSPIIKEWADMVLFCNYKTIIVTNDSGKGKAQGGKRVMYTQHHTCWDAKNRHGLKGELPMEYKEIAHLFGGAIGKPPVTLPASAHVVAVSAAQEEVAANPTSRAATNAAPAVPAIETPASAKAASTAETVEPPFVFGNELDGIHPQLADLLKANKVMPTEIQIVVGAKGYLPTDMPVKDYPKDFVEGCLIAAWDSVYKCVIDDRNSIPF